MPKSTPAEWLCSGPPLPGTATILHRVRRTHTDNILSIGEIQAASLTRHRHYVHGVGRRDPNDAQFERGRCFLPIGFPRPGGTTRGDEMRYLPLIVLALGVTACGGASASVAGLPSASPTYNDAGTCRLFGV